MTGSAVLLQLAWEFAKISLMTIGGGLAAIPEMHRIVVDVHGWMTSETFANLFALAQAAPGPNLIVVPVIGWEIAGAAGAAAATLGIFGPAFVLAYCVIGLWSRWNRTGWYQTLERGIAPVTIGLVLATGWVLTSAANGVSWRAYLVTISTAALVVFTRVNPLIALAVAGGLGVAGVL